MSPCARWVPDSQLYQPCPSTMVYYCHVLPTCFAHLDGDTLHGFLARIRDRNAGLVVHEDLEEVNK